jgi:hypothetical protein
MDGMTPIDVPEIQPDPIQEADDSERVRAEQAEDEANAEIVQMAKECFTTGLAADATWRQEAVKDIQFLVGDQWDPTAKAQRDARGAPALTVNRIPQFVRQVTNEQRQSKPAVTVSPVDDGSDKRTAEVFQGVIRNIEVSSNADAAYAAGGQSAAITGKGYWDIACEYEDERSFEQKIVIRRIKNPMSVVMDPGTKELAGDDARWAILSTDISTGEWKSKWPHIEMPKGADWKAEGDAAADWVARDGVRIHEFRYITDEPDTLIDDPDGGEPMLASELADIAAAQMEQASGASVADYDKVALAKRIIAKAKASKIHTRPTTRRKACWAKIAGDQVVEKGELAGKYLQLVRVVGTEVDLNGETIYEGVIRHARDPQKILNLMVSSEAEAISLAPKSPWVATDKQIEGREEMWATANSKAHSVLIFNSDPQNPGPPQRVMSEANVSAITNARMQAADDLKATTGIYDGQLGARSNETSGRAILARQSQGQTANFHFQDNLAMAIRYTGRVLIDLIPRLYSGPRVLRILGEDGKTPEMVPVNGHPGDFRGQSAEQNPIFLDAGRYDVTVSMGPSYQSRRQEIFAQLMELLKMNPSVSSIVMDLLVDSMDMPNGKVIADRLRKMLPPEIKPPDDGTPPPQILAQQLAQSQQMIEQMTQQLHALSTQIETNAQDNAAKKEIELTKLHAQVLMKLAELDSAESVALLKAEAVSIGNQRRASERATTPQPQPQPMPQGGMPNGL